MKAYIKRLRETLHRSWIRLQYIRVTRKRRDHDARDQALIATLNHSRWPSWKQTRYTFRHLKRSQRLLLVTLFLVMLASGTTLLARWYFHATNVIPAPGGSYTEALIGAPRFINPILAQTNDVDLDMAQLLFPGLLKRTKDFELVPDLAASYTISEDKKTYTFVLRENLFWEDGAPLTVDDVRFTVEAIQHPEWKSPLEPTLRGIRATIVDERTIQFSLTEPFAPFLESLTFGILPQHIWGDIPPQHAALAEFNLRPIGAGAFRVKSFTRDVNGNIQTYTLIRNPRYHGPATFLEKIQFKFFPDFDSAVEALKNKRVDGISFLPKRLAPALAQEKNIKRYTLRAPQYTAIFINQRRASMLSDVRVRKALAQAIHREQIIRDILHDEAEIINGPILPDALGFHADLPKHAFDQEKAKELLKEAGWTRIDQDRYRELWEKEQQQKLEDAKKEQDATEEKTETVAQELTIKKELPEPALEYYWEKRGIVLTVALTTIDQEELAAEAEQIKMNWEHIGIPTHVEYIEASRFGRDVIRPRYYELLLTNVLLGADTDPYPFWHASQIDAPGLNLAQYSNREVDDLLEKARKTVETTVRASLYKTFQEKIVTDVPAIFLYNPTYTYVLGNDVKGFGVSRIITPANRFTNINEWYINTQRVFK